MTLDTDTDALIDVTSLHRLHAKTKTTMSHQMQHQQKDDFPTSDVVSVSSVVTTAASPTTFFATHQQQQLQAAGRGSSGSIKPSYTSIQQQPPPIRHHPTAILTSVADMNVQRQNHHPFPTNNVSTNNYRFAVPHIYPSIPDEVNHRTEKSSPFSALAVTSRTMSPQQIQQLGQQEQPKVPSHPSSSAPSPSMTVAPVPVDEKEQQRSSTVATSWGGGGGSSIQPLTSDGDDDANHHLAPVLLAGGGGSAPPPSSSSSRFSGRRGGGNDGDGCCTFARTEVSREEGNNSSLGRREPTSASQSYLNDNYHYSASFGRIPVGRTTCPSPSSPPITLFTSALEITQKVSSLQVRRLRTAVLLTDRTAAHVPSRALRFSAPVDCVELQASFVGPNSASRINHAVYRQYQLPVLEAQQQEQQQQLALQQQQQQQDLLAEGSGVMELESGDNTYDRTMTTSTSDLTFLNQSNNNNNSDRQDYNNYFGVNQEQQRSSPPSHPGSGVFFPPHQTNNNNANRGGGGGGGDRGALIPLFSSSSRRISEYGGGGSIASSHGIVSGGGTGASNYNNYNHRHHHPPHHPPFPSQQSHNNNSNNRGPIDCLRAEFNLSKLRLRERRRSQSASSSHRLRQNTYSSSNSQQQQRFASIYKSDTGASHKTTVVDGSLCSTYNVQPTPPSQRRQQCPPPPPPLPPSAALPPKAKSAVGTTTTAPPRDVNNGVNTIEVGLRLGTTTGMIKKKKKKKPSSTTTSNEASHPQATTTDELPGATGTIKKKKKRKVIMAKKVGGTISTSIVVVGGSGVQTLEESRSASSIGQERTDSEHNNVQTAVEQPPDTPTDNSSANNSPRKVVVVVAAASSGGERKEEGEREEEEGVYLRDVSSSSGEEDDDELKVAEGIPTERHGIVHIIDNADITPPPVIGNVGNMNALHQPHHKHTADAGILITSAATTTSMFGADEEDEGVSSRYLYHTSNKSDDPSTVAYPIFRNHLQTGKSLQSSSRLPSTTKGHAAAAADLLRRGGSTQQQQQAMMSASRSSIGRTSRVGPPSNYFGGASGSGYEEEEEQSQLLQEPHNISICGGYITIRTMLYDPTVLSLHPAAAHTLIVEGTSSLAAEKDHDLLKALAIQQQSILKQHLHQEDATAAKFFLSLPPLPPLRPTVPAIRLQQFQQAFRMIVVGNHSRAVPLIEDTIALIHRHISEFTARVYEYEMSMEEVIHVAKKATSGQRRPPRGSQVGEVIQRVGRNVKSRTEEEEEEEAGTPATTARKGDEGEDGSGSSSAVQSIDDNNINEEEGAVDGDGRLMEIDRDATVGPLIRLVGHLSRWKRIASLRVNQHLPYVRRETAHFENSKTQRYLQKKGGGGY